jgi:hypothetical protein
MAEMKDESASSVHVKQSDGIKENQPATEEGKQGCSTFTVLSYIDLFGVEERPENPLGGIITLIIVPLGLIYAIILLLQTFDTDLQVSNDLKWSPHDEFPITIKCVSSSGCLVSNHYWEDLSSSSCSYLKEDEEYDTYISYFDNPKNGISILSNENNQGGYNYTNIIEVKSETYMPWMASADSDGTYMMWGGVIAGTNYLNMVKTSNFTLKGSGRQRKEYFGFQVDFNGDLLPDSTVCSTTATLASYNWTTSDNLQQVRLRLQASYNHIRVTNPASLLSWFGTSSGMYAAMFGYGALLLFIFEEWLGKDHMFTYKRKTLKVHPV